jgi:nucleoid-associated protein YgaU
MKKFSTAAVLLVFASVFLSATSHAADADEAKVIANAANAPHCSFLDNAPDQHVVVTGDTLWGISGKFLQHPWCWPQVWDLNREQISNPHWIYPGQIVYFDRAAGRLRLGTPVSGQSDNRPSSDGRMGPQIRTENIGGRAISSIPANVIEPFLSKPLIITENEMKDSPRIIATQEGHVVVGLGDHAYVRGDLKGEKSFQVYRPGTPLKDPDTQKIIGYQAVYLGAVKVTHTGKTADEADTVDVVSTAEEISVGDRLSPTEPTPLINYVPHAPAQPISSRIISIYEGVNNAGQNQIVSINRGRQNGIDVGTVLSLYRFGPIIPDPTDNKKMVKLPDEEYGSLFVFRVFDNISYGLIMEIRDSAEAGDIAKSPE